MKTSYNIFQDSYANKGNLKGQIVMVLFRIAHLATISNTAKIFMIPYLIFYRIFVEWFLGIEIQYPVKIGPGLKLWHGQATVIHQSTTIGANCTLRQCTTIGNKRNADGSKSSGAIIGNNVDIGAGVYIIGNIKIQSNCVIGAGTIITKDFDEAAIIVGNPGRILRSLGI